MSTPTDFNIYAYDKCCNGHCGYFMKGCYEAPCNHCTLNKYCGNYQRTMALDSCVYNIDSRNVNSYVWDALSASSRGSASNSGGSGSNSGGSNGQISNEYLGTLYIRLDDLVATSTTQGVFDISVLKVLNTSRLWKELGTNEADKKISADYIDYVQPTITLNGVSIESADGAFAINGVAKTDAGNTFAGDQTFNGNVSVTGGTSLGNVSIAGEVTLGRSNFMVVPSCVSAGLVKTDAVVLNEPIDSSTSFDTRINTVASFGDVAKAIRYIYSKCKI